MCVHKKEGGKVFNYYRKKRSKVKEVVLITLRDDSEDRIIGTIKAFFDENEVDVLVMIEDNDITNSSEQEKLKLDIITQFKPLAEEYESIEITFCIPNDIIDICNDDEYEDCCTELIFNNDDDSDDIKKTRR